MGYGDDLMATAEARRVHSLDPMKKVAIGDGERAYWSPVFDHNPIIATLPEIRSGTPVNWAIHCSGRRPYIDYDAMRTPTKAAPRFVWKNTGPLMPGEIWFSDPTPLMTRHVVIEPHIKTKASPNKDWGFDRFQAVIDIMPDVRFVQPSYGLPILHGAIPVETTDFVWGARLLIGAAAYVGPEGGLHHAAAAVGTQAVVIFGGFISPAQTGYRLHRNLFTGGEPCGNRSECQHCREAMNAITPRMVAAELDAILESQQPKEWL